MKPRKPDESDEHYIKRLESANEGLRRDNKAMAKWASSLNEAITVLSTQGSLAFQALAEKARVRSHPSVTKVVELFDLISHPQWRNQDQRLPEIEFPEEWDFDQPGAWSGDADMSFNAPIAKAIEYLTSRRFRASNKERDWEVEIIAGLEKVLRERVEGIKDGCGFIARTVTIPSAEHYRKMDRDQLAELVSALGWMALDLAQDMAFANEMLRRDLRAATYRRVAADLYRLAFLETNEPPGQFNVKVLGGEAAPF